MSKTTPQKRTINQFFDEFHNDDACLNYLFRNEFGEITLCPNCSNYSEFTKIKNRKAYQCPKCSYQIYPTANTIFHKSSTSLRCWFSAIYLSSILTNGISSRNLEKLIPVSNKTALRMTHQIQTILKDNSTDKFTGIVSVDETYIGAETKNWHEWKRIARKIGGGYAHRTGVMTIIEQQTGRVRTIILKVESKLSNSNIVKKYVDSSAILVTDSAKHFAGLDKYFKRHIRVNHKMGEFVKEGLTSNFNENYNSTLKRRVKGTHINVDPKYLSKYASLNTFKYIHRNKPHQIFDLILQRVRKSNGHPVTPLTSIE